MSRLRRSVPPAALEYCYLLWFEHPFRLVLSRPRRSKLGDFRWELGRQQAVITVNTNLNPFSFLITYVHEVAHLRVSLEQPQAPAHGTAWKQSFATLMRPLLTESVFPPSLLHTIQRHLKNPKASSQADPHLVEELRKHDPEPGLSLDALPLGSGFELQGRVFIKGEKRRTRYLCTEPRSGRKFLVPGVASVNPLPG
ncbi:MAG: transcription elongation protein SprT [Cytophagales bacterium]|nr:transcription elongation protein SprT [Cytophagales bacterium]